MEVGLQTCATASTSSFPLGVTRPVNVQQTLRMRTDMLQSIARQNALESPVNMFMQQ